MVLDPRPQSAPPRLARRLDGQALWLHGLLLLRERAERQACCVFL